ncbi:S-adenosyl-L-homocysteine hydrolase, NAD binding domain, partial [Musa troglodytarum]
MLMRSLNQGFQSSSSVSRQHGVPIWAKQRGPRMTEESHLGWFPCRPSGVCAKIGEIRVGGRVKDDTYQRTKVGSFRVDVSFDGSLIPCRQVDQLGMIGAIGSILGEQNM